MAYDLDLADRARMLLRLQNGYSERKMFGGIAFFLHGNMACGVTGSDLMVRVGRDKYETCLTEQNVEPFDMTGRPMAGWVRVTSQGLVDEAQLQRWVQMGVELALSLPPK